MSLQSTLVEQLDLCVDYLWKSERYELIADVSKPVIAVFEKQRDFKVAFISDIWFYDMQSANLEAEYNLTLHRNF